MRDSKELKVNIVAHIGVGGAERLHLQSDRDLPLPTGNTIQRSVQGNLICVGNVNKGGKGQFGYTYYEQGLAPTIAAGTHGYCIGHILIEENETDSIRIYGQRNRETPK